MVLAELGAKLRDSIRKLHASTSVTEKELNVLLSEVTRALIESDVNVKLVLQLRQNIQQKVQHLLDSSPDGNDKNDNDDDDSDDDDNDTKKKTNATTRRSNNNRNLPKIVQRAVVDELTNLLQPIDNKKKIIVPYTMKRGKSNVILFVGLQGSGKTTTIAKFANYYQRKGGWKIAMVCADTFRAGALDQLKQNATKLRIPFYGSYSESDPVRIATAGVQQFRKDKYDIIIVDTSGRHKQETALLDEMQEIAIAVQPDNTILVIDATQGQAVFDQALAFRNAVDVGSVIITKIDGNSKGGGALSAVAATNSPIQFIGSGEHFDDLDPFFPDGFISKLMGFGDVKGLMDAMKNDDSNTTNNNEFLDKMSKGIYTLRDMYKQFEKILNMGPLNKIAGMLPGMPDYLIPKGGDQEATNRLRKFMIMMDSMTDGELDGKVDFSKKYDPVIESRIRRIAAGSGCYPAEVKMLLQVHKQFETMVSRMGKSGLMGKNAVAKQQQLAAQMRKNPNLISQRINQMDPRVLQQMGGREHVMNMMQQMAKNGGTMPPPGAGGPGGFPGAGGGMPSMEAMQAMMQSMGGGMGGGGGLGGRANPFGGSGGAGGMPPPPQPGGAGGFPGIPPGMDMQQLMKMAEAFGGGAGGGLFGGGGAGAGAPPRR